VSYAHITHFRRCCNLTLNQAEKKNVSRHFCRQRQTYLDCMSSLARNFVRGDTVCVHFLIDLFLTHTQYVLLAPLASVSGTCRRSQGGGRQGCSLMLVQHPPSDDCYTKAASQSPASTSANPHRLSNQQHHKDRHEHGKLFCKVTVVIINKTKY